MGSRFDRGGMGTDSFTPGPGNYNTSGISRPNSGITIGGKYQETRKEADEPGPGSYNLSQSRNVGPKIGTSKRKDLLQKEDVPGPGQYTYDKRPYSAGPRYGFGKAGKGNGYIESAPGPGQYDPNSYLNKNDNKGCTMGSRFGKNDHGPDLAPGPGYYDTNLKRPASGTKIGRAKRGGVGGQNTPGPGAYDNSYRTLHGAKIGTSKRGDYGKSDTPGPGAYYSMKSIKGGITISGHKGKIKFDEVPGPGAYNSGDYNRMRPCSAK